MRRLEVSLPTGAAGCWSWTASSGADGQLTRRPWSLGFGPRLGGQLRLAEPGDGLLETLLECHDRFVAKEATRLADVGLRVAHVSGAGLGVDRCHVCAR